MSQEKEISDKERVEIPIDAKDTPVAAMLRLFVLSKKTPLITK